MTTLFPVKVTRWITETSFKTYIFDTTNQIYDNDITVIKEYIYQDDNIEYAINKIIYYIANIEKIDIPRFYSWVKNESLLFDIDVLKWKGYNINPFKSKNRNSEELKEPITYKYKSGLFNKKKLNIVFLSDFKENIKYYFIDNKNTLVNFKKRELIMSQIYNKDLIYTRILSETYHRIDLCTSLKKPINLSMIFDLATTNNTIQMIQWCNDSSQILYKLHKKHNFKEKFLNQITNLDKIKIFNCINFYCMMSNGTYCKACIYNNGLIIVSYILDLRSNINWNDMINNKIIIVKYLQNITKNSIHLKETNINVNIYYNIDNSSFSVLSKKIGEYIDIFHVVKLTTEKNRNKIICIYKRSANYNKEPINISEYIQSRLNLGIDEKDLSIELINLGINKADVDLLITNEISAIYLMQDLNKIKIPNTGTIVTIEQYKQGYMVEILNCTSKYELKSLLFWLSRIIENTRIVSKVIQKVKPDEIKKVSLQSSDKSSDKSSISSDKSTSSDNNIGNKSFDLGNDDDFFQGGALGKQKHGYFMNLLKNADKDLFGENYAREKCQAAFQPLVLSKSEKDNLEKKDMLKYFDNIIQHGSKKNIQNFYTCPRLWCPVSKIPLDYNIPDPKCPIDNEEPMKLYWNKDITKPRYAKLTAPDENGLSVPCCFKKEFSKKDTKVVKTDAKDSINEKKIEIDKDENYIMNKISPIPLGRFGVIPEKLHNMLLPNTNYSDCSKSLSKTEKCFIRKGIIHKKKNILYHKDSILYSIIYLLGFKDKTAFIKDVKKKLDIITFISLENGNVCKDFLDMKPVIQDDNKRLCKMFFNNVDNNIFDISNLKCSIPSYKLSRLLNIYKSYLKFLDFLSTDIYPTDKGAIYFYSILSSLYNVLLIVWEKDDNDINVICPIYTSYKDIITGLDLDPLFIMILKDGAYYEPLEIKMRNIESERYLKLNEYPNLKNILEECDKTKEHINYNIVKNIELLSNFIKTKTLKNSKTFFIKTVIINNDLTINKFMTNSNILITIKYNLSISLLPNLIKSLSLKNIVFYDDIAGNIFDINVLNSDLEIFSLKCNENNIEINIGEIVLKNKNETYSKLEIKKQLINDNIIIHSDIKNYYHNYKLKDYKISKKWFQLQKMVAKKLLSVYTDKLLAELIKLPREDIILDLMKHFQNFPQKEKNFIQIILEEIPLYSIKHIEKWYDNVLLYIKYDLFSGEIKENGKSFIFSQYNINEKIPDTLLTYHESSPIKSLKDIQIKQYKFENKIELTENLPELYKGTPEKLKSKWTKHKKMIWDKMVLRRINYNKRTIPEFFEWLSKKLQYNIDYDEIEKITWVKYFNIINNRDVMINLLSDNTFYKEYIEKMNALLKIKGKVYKTVMIFWENCYKNLDMKDKKEILNNVLKNNKIYPNDLNLLSITEILNVSILIIHRTQYGKSSKDIKRGELEDFLLSSTLLPAQSNFNDRPFIILSKEYDKKYCCYYSITENDKNIYIQYKDVPSDIKALVEAHLNY